MINLLLHLALTICCIWFLRRMEKVKCTEKIANKEVLNKTIQNSNITSDISKRQISFLGK